MNKNPEQTEQTRKNIMDAFLKIARKKGLNKTSVSNVMKAAGYNRGTFYVYFTDLNDLIFQIEQEILQNYQHSMEIIIEELHHLNFETASQMVAEFIMKNDETIFLFLKEDSGFITRVTNCMSDKIVEFYSELKNNPYQQYIIYAFASSVVGMLMYWDETGRKVSINLVIKELQKIWVAGLTRMQK